MSEVSEVEDVGHEGKEGQTHEDAVEKAFQESHGHSLGDIPLEPYSRARRYAAAAMGLYYGKLTEAEFEEFLKTKLYPQAMRDVGIVMWLCSIKDHNKISAITRNPKAFEDEMQEWSEKQGLDDTSDDEFWEGFSEFADIMKEREVSRVNAKKKMTKEKST